MTDTSDAALDAMVMKAHRYTYKADHDAGLFVLDLADTITALREKLETAEALINDGMDDGAMVVIAAERAEVLALRRQVDALRAERELLTSERETFAVALWEAEGKLSTMTAERDAAYARGEHDAGDEYLRKASVWESDVDEAICALADAPPAPVVRVSDISEMIAKSVAALKAMTPAEREAMYDIQRQSYVRAEAGFGSDADEAEYRQAVLAQDTETIKRLNAEADARVALAEKMIEGRDA